MSAPKALGWDKIACLFFQVLGRLAHQLQIRPDCLDYPHGVLLLSPMVGQFWSSHPRELPQV